MRKRILIVETLYPEGHKACNEARIQILSQFADLILIDDGTYYSKMDISPNIKHVYVKHGLPDKILFAKIKKWIPFIKYSPLEFFAYLWYYIKVSVKTLFIKYDDILFLSARTDALFFGRLFFKKPIFVVHHNDIDRLFVKSFDMKVFHKYKNKINHIVIANFIKDGLINELNVNSDKVFVVHEALVRKSDVKLIQFEKKKKLLIGLGQTCDENVLKEMIKIDQSNDYPIEYQILMRNKSLQYEGNNLIITKEYLDREDYNDLLEKAIACVLFYPEEFNLRYSGVIGDSLEHGLSIFGNGIPVVEYYASIYPHTCHVISSPQELYQQIRETDIKASKDEIADFFEKHCRSYIENQFREAFNCIQ